MRPNTKKMAMTTIADAPSAQFLAMPSRLSAAGPAPVINPSIAAAQAKALASEVADKLLANPVIESYRVEVD